LFLYGDPAFELNHSALQVQRFEEANKIRWKKPQIHRL